MQSAETVLDVLRERGRRGVNVQVLGLAAAVRDDGYVLAAGVVLPWWLSVVSGMIRGCDRCAAGGSA